MRILVVSGLIIALLVQVFSKTIIYTNFLINQEYIAKNLCENRSAPEKHCCGKCQLKKQMENEQKEESLPASFKLNDETFFEVVSSYGSAFTQYASATLLFPGYLAPLSKTFPQTVFHPPSAS